MNINQIVMSNTHYHNLLALHKKIIAVKTIFQYHFIKQALLLIKYLPLEK